MQWATAVGLEKSMIENREQTENREQRTENRETNYKGHSNRRWIVGLSGPITKHG